MRNAWLSECYGIKTFVINIFLKVIYLCEARAPKLVFYKTLLNKSKPQFLLWNFSWISSLGLGLDLLVSNLDFGWVLN